MNNKKTGIETQPTIQVQKIIEYLKERIEREKHLNIDLDSADWGMEEGIIITVNEAQEIVDCFGSVEQNPSADEYDMIATFDWYEVAPANLINELKTSFWGAGDIEDPMVHIGFYEYWFHLQNEKEENKFNEIMNRYRINKNYKSHTIMDN